MALKIYALDTITGACELVRLVDYPSVSSNDGSITIVPTTDAQGKTTFDLRVSHDVNMDVAGFDPTTLTITLTETDGDTFTIDLSVLRSKLTGLLASGHAIGVHDDGSGITQTINETVTSVAVSGAGFTYTDENGNDTTIPLCDMLNNVTDSGTTIGGI